MSAPPLEPMPSAKLRKTKRAAAAAGDESPAAEQRPPEEQLAVRALLAGDTIFARIYHNLTVLSPCPVGRSMGPGMVICNHTSPIDPLFLQSVCRHRLITWMMAREYLQVKGLGWLFKAVGIIPVERSGRDSGSLRAALRALQSGRILGIFPEGRIEETPDLLPFHSGAALMAIKAGVTIYPAYLDGTQRGQGMVQACVVPNSATLAFGPPLRLDGFTTSKEDLDAATDVLRNAVDSLRQLTARYTAQCRGHRFLPSLAGSERISAVVK